MVFIHEIERHVFSICELSICASVCGEKRERINVNKYGKKFRKAGAWFQPLVLEARSGAMSKTIAKIIKKNAGLAGDIL
jgi:hypothetical protein